MANRRTLTKAQLKVLNRFRKLIDGRLRSQLNSCVHCGLCGQSCHYYLNNPDLRYLPGYKVEQLARIYRRYFTSVGRLFPWWNGAKDLDKQVIQEMADILFGNCSLCGRCTLHCSIGIDIPFVVRTGRTLLVELGLVPQTLQSTVDTAIHSGNNMAIPREELIDTLKWLEDELQLDISNTSANIPLDRSNQKILYTLNPREPKFFPMSITAIAKIFHVAKEKWTISTHAYDVTNYAYFSGDNDAARDLVNRLYKEVVRLKADVLVLAECGHGFRAFRWEGPNWIRKGYPFQVKSVIEIIAEYIRDGKILLDPQKNDQLVTLHDPCNLVRTGGLIEEQRFIIKKAVSQFVEMSPNRANNYCCGGGGGQLSMSEYRDRRISAGKMKAEQIRKTGAKIVATPCHNCIDQLLELNKEYQLGIQIKTISEIVADALICN
jgi:Fe-S oxidoreductase